VIAMGTIDQAGRCSVMSPPLKSITRKIVTADARIEARMKPISDSPAVEALGTLSEIGDQLQMRTLCGSMIALGLVTSNKRLWNAGARMLVAHEVATLLKDAIKRRVDRTRPRSAESQEDRKASPGKSTAKEETSFPSGHSAGATAAAFAFAGEYPEHRMPALAAAGAVSAAQVPRCAHYLTDVGAGMLIGAAAGVATNL
jgi:membrane-associated phospholipid phosphatase